jgi:hypothetical protein
LSPLAHNCDFGDFFVIILLSGPINNQLINKMNDPVNHPSHCTSSPSGIETILVTEHENFCIGNAIKYLLRCDKKGNAIQDLNKALWYVTREIHRREKLGQTK